MVQQCAFAPEGHLRIAQRFIAGKVDNARISGVPEGRLKRLTAPFFSRPSGTFGLLTYSPAINRWAIFKRPSGTGKGGLPIKSVKLSVAKATSHK